MNLKILFLLFFWASEEINVNDESERIKNIWGIKLDIDFIIF